MHELRRYVLPRGSALCEVPAVDEGVHFFSPCNRALSPGYLEELGYLFLTLALVPSTTTRSLRVLRVVVPGTDYETLVLQVPIRWQLRTEYGPYCTRSVRQRVGS